MGIRWRRGWTGSGERPIALNHTATHLLHAALREVLGAHVKQAGSLVAADRFRFDFSHFTQVGPENLREVENLVNRLIRENLPLSTREMGREEAMKTGAMAIFEERYGEKVRLVSVGDGVSMELCGGTHTTRTGDIGLFKILSEGAVGANVRRIEAVTGRAALEHVQHMEDEELRHAAALLKTGPEQLRERLEKLLRDQKQREREMDSLKAKVLSTQSGDLLAGVKEVNGVPVLVQEVQAGLTQGTARLCGSRSRRSSHPGSSCSAPGTDGKAMLLCVVTKDLVGKHKAGDLMRRLSEIVGGKGGGRPDMAQGGGPNPEELRPRWMRSTA